MTDERVLIMSLRCEGTQWITEVSFRGGHYTMAFGSDDEGRLCEVAPTPFTLTLEGHEIREIVERVRGGEVLSLPHAVEPAMRGPRLPSVHSPSWVASFGPIDVWLDAVERVGDAHFVARLRVGEESDVYDVEVLAGPELKLLRSPRNPKFHSYAYDLECMLLRMHRGARFSLPFKLRPRWPTPEEPAAVPPET